MLIMNNEGYTSVSAAFGNFATSTDFLNQPVQNNKRTGWFFHLFSIFLQKKTMKQLTLKQMNYNGRRIYVLPNSIGGDYLVCGNDHIPILQLTLVPSSFVAYTDDYHMVPVTSTTLDMYTLSYTSTVPYIEKFPHKRIVTIGGEQYKLK